MYSDFYQFSEKPFEDNPDPKFIYLTPSYQEVLASILTWIRESHGFSAITGEAGTGKTYFIHALVNHIDEKVKIIIILYPPITFKELLKQILLELNQPVQENTETALFHQFTRFLNQLMTEDKTLLIIFDEAQSLNDKTLEGIARSLDLRSKPIRIIFVGQPHFDERLSSSGLSKLGKRIKVKHRIKSFTEVESRGHINHRLRLVGSTSQIFTPKAIFMICSYTQGIPSLINHVCDNAFRVGFTMNQGKSENFTTFKKNKSLNEIILVRPLAKNSCRNTLHFLMRRFISESRRISLRSLHSAICNGWELFHPEENEHKPW